MTQRLGRYEIHRRIAAGGMATVYLGRVVGEGGFQRLVAVKVMHPHLAEDPDFVAMFLDEARLAALIRHPNVVATLDVQRVPEGLFLVMDYIDGPTLARILKLLERAGRTMDLSVALRIFLDTLAGLDAAHELVGPSGEQLNLVHRDVSPSNVLVGTDGIARITDFGIARAEARITSTRGRQLKGKLPYMAPEQLASQPIDRRVDVYACGCVLWEMLTLHRLFQGDDEAQLLAAVLAGVREPPSALRSDVPPSIDLVCMQALSHQKHRFPSTAAFADALEDAARHDGVRIAAARDVGRFVRELAPAPSTQAQAPLPEFNVPLTPPRGATPLGVETPQRWQMTPPVSAGVTGVGGHTPPPMPVMPGAAGSDPMAAVMGHIPGTTLSASGMPTTAAGQRPLPGGGLVLDTNPNTIASMVATPATLGGGKRRTVLTVLAAMGLASVGGAVAWLVVGPNSVAGSGGPPSAGSDAAATTASPSAGETEAASTGSTSESARSDGSAEPSATGLAAPGGRIVVRRRPDGKGTAEPRTTTAPVPTPAPTPTEFRPNRP
jgi:hypothetical protein